MNVTVVIQYGGIVTQNTFFRTHYKKDAFKPRSGQIFYCPQYIHLLTAKYLKTNKKQTIRYVDIS